MPSVVRAAERRYDDAVARLYRAFALHVYTLF